MGGADYEHTEGHSRIWGYDTVYRGMSHTNLTDMLFYTSEEEGSVSAEAIHLSLSPPDFSAVLTHFSST